MTMRTLLTAAIITSVGIGASAPAPQPSTHSSAAPMVLAGIGADFGYALTAIAQQGDPLPPEPWANADPADSLYRLAREALSRGDYKRAAEIFHRIPERYPQSAYAGQAMYYEAFALYRSGSEDDLNTARDRLKQLKVKFPAISKKDGELLLTRVCGELAKHGDEECTTSISKGSEDATDITSGQTLTIPRSQGQNCSPDADEVSDDRIAALNALLQM